MATGWSVSSVQKQWFPDPAVWEMICVSPPETKTEMEMDDESAHMDFFCATP